MFTSKNNMVETSSKRFKRSLLAVSIMALSVPTFAQAPSQDENLEEVVVTGMRSSLDTAQELKRSADTVKDVITASDIGSLPDKSVTEALQRVPGVTIERFASSEDPNHFADEGTGVLVRGLDRVRSEVNGRDSFSANPYSGLNYEDFSPELLSAVEVVKNQTADLIAGGVAGTVNLITRKPFDNDGTMAAFTAKASYGDFREELTPSFSGLFSTRWDTDAGEFGFLLSASASEFKSRGDGVGVANYYTRGDAFIGVYDQWGGLVGIDPNSPLDGPALPGQAAGTINYIPGQFSLRTAENDRERTGLTTSLQWQNTDETIVATIEHISSEASLEWRERVIGTQGQGFAASTRFGAILVPTADMPVVIGEDGYFQSGIMRPNAELPMSTSSRWNYSENTVADTSLNVKLMPTDRLTVELDYQHIESDQTLHNYGHNSRYITNTTAGVAPADAYLDLTSDTPKIEFLSPKFTNPGISDVWGNPRHDMFYGTAIDEEAFNEAEADSFKLDVEYQMDGVWKSIKSGVYYSEKDLVVRDTEYSNWGAINRGWVDSDINASSPLTIPDEFETVDFSDFYKGGVVSGQDQFIFPKMSNVKDFIGTARRSCEDGWNNAPNGGNAANSLSQNSPNCFLASGDLGNRLPLSVFAPHDVTSTNEERVEAYVRADFVWDDLSMPIKANVGLRYVSYQLESSGYLVLPAPVVAEAGEIFNAKYPNIAALTSQKGQLQTVDGTDYSTVLPSLNVALSLTDDVIMRFGASNALYFPTLDQTRNSRIVSLTSTNVRQFPGQPGGADNPIVDVIGVEINGIARNPFLEPEEATNIDLSTEWYFANAGSLTLAVFNKSIDNLFRERSFLAPVTNIETGATEDVSFSGPSNDGSGSITGYEIAYSQFYDFLPGIWSGLGLQLNYTYLDQSDLNDLESGLGGVRFDSQGNPISDGRNSFRAFTNLSLPGYSDENYNIIGMFEYADVSARLAYTWRSDYLVTRRDSNEAAPIYSKAAGYLDASVFYSFNENWKVGVEASNLLDTETETLAQVNQEGLKKESLNFTTDKRFAISLKGTF
jgi:iron complex outermembrane recepter protein